jgi:hypothetical protein
MEAKSMKGEIQPGHVGQNRFELLVLGAPKLVFVEMSEIESETPWVVLPDRTQASGGEEEPGEFTVQHPMHHKIERAFMEAWLQEGRDPVSPGYKKVATAIWYDIHGNVAGAWALTGLGVSKRSLPSGEKANEGEMATVEWTFKFDSAPPLPA